MKQLFALSLVCVLCAASTASADLLITEIHSKAQIDVEDFFEITNLGTSAVDIAGWKYDDVSADINDAAALNGISLIAPGESVVFFQVDSDPVADAVTFKAFWGGLDGVQVGYYDGAGLGKNDAVTIFDDNDNIVLSQAYGDTSPETTHAGDWAAGNFDGSDTYENESAIWQYGTIPAQFVVAADGVLGSFANTSGSFGSPGVVVPEPTSAFLVLSSVVCLISRRRR